MQSETMFTEAAGMVVQDFVCLCVCVCWSVGYEFLSDGGALSSRLFKVGLC